jgi:hypothetical protein
MNYRFNEDMQERKKRNCWEKASRGPRMEPSWRCTSTRELILDERESNQRPGGARDLGCWRALLFFLSFSQVLGRTSQHPDAGIDKPAPDAS